MKKPTTTGAQMKKPTTTGAQMKKPTLKAQLTEANLNLDRVLGYIHVLLGDEKTFASIRQMMEFNLKDLDDRIEDVSNYAKENPPGSTYCSAGNDSRKRVKKLQKARKEVVKTITMFNQFVKQKNKAWVMLCTI